MWYFSKAFKYLPFFPVFIISILSVAVPYVCPVISTLFDYKQLLFSSDGVNLFIISNIKCERNFQEIMRNVAKLEWHVSIESLLGFYILTAVIMKNTIFWDIMTCSQLKVNRSLGGTNGKVDIFRRKFWGSSSVSWRPHTSVSFSSYTSTNKLKAWLWVHHYIRSSRLLHGGLRGTGCP